MDALFNLLFPKGFHYPEIHIPSLTGEELIHGIPWYTNTHFTMLLVVLLLSGLAIVSTRTMREVPSGLQNFVELVVQGLSDFLDSVGGKEATKRLPLLGTLFLFILFANWTSVLPFVGQVHWLHKPTADYHVNFGIALSVFVLYQIAGFRANGIGYVKRWFNLSGFKDGPFLGAIFVLVGFIEFFSEIFRVVTLTLRLWGNMLGGEITLGVMSALLIIPGLAFPFYGLEVFVGLVQALVFMLLVLMYFVSALESHDDHDKHEDASTATAHPEPKGRPVLHAGAH